MKTLSTVLETKNLGLIIIGISIAIAFVLIPPTIRIATIEAEKCIHVGGAPCPLVSHIPIESFFGFGFTIILGIIGVILTLRSQEKEKMDQEMRAKLSEAKRKLQGDERKIYDIIATNEGVIFQSELVEKTSFPKVKVSRILDKLEGKGLVERRRRGLSNVILIKYR